MNDRSPERTPGGGGGGGGERGVTPLPLMRLGYERAAVHLDGSTTSIDQPVVSLLKEPVERFVERYGPVAFTYVVLVALQADTVVDGRLRAVASDESIGQKMNMSRQRVGKVRQALEADKFFDSTSERDERGAFARRIAVLDPARLAEAIANPQVTASGANPNSGRERPGQPSGTESTSGSPASGFATGGERIGGRERPGQPTGSAADSGAHGVVGVEDDDLVHHWDGGQGQAAAWLAAHGFDQPERWLARQDVALVIRAIREVEAGWVQPNNVPGWIRNRVEHHERYHVRRPRTNPGRPAEGRPSVEPAVVTATPSPATTVGEWPAVPKATVEAVAAALAALDPAVADQIEFEASRRRRTGITSPRLREWDWVCCQADLVGVAISVPAEVLAVLDRSPSTARDAG